MPERDIAFWVPILAGTRKGDAFEADRLVWLLAYTFVDNTAALVTGREVFGFPKSQATLFFPEDAGSAGAFSVDTLVIKQFRPNNRAEIARLVTVESPKRGIVTAGTNPWPILGDGFQELGARIATGILSTVEKALVPAVEVARKLVDSFCNKKITMVFLKQFRDARDPERACYQAVVEAPAVVDTWYGGGFLPTHRVTIAPADSHPIVEELGLPGATVESVLGMWLTYDFTAESGVVIHESTLAAAQRRGREV